MSKSEGDRNTTAQQGKGEFETILHRLEQIVGDLEGGSRSLEESLSLFEEGVKLSRDGHAILDRAETKVQTLLESGEIVDGIAGAAQASVQGTAAGSKRG